jgi:hypothetical protein
VAGPRPGRSRRACLVPKAASIMIRGCIPRARELSFCVSSDIFMKDDMDPKITVAQRKFSVRLQKLEGVTDADTMLTESRRLNSEESPLINMSNAIGHSSLIAFSSAHAEELTLYASRITN